MIIIYYGISVSKCLWCTIQLLDTKCCQDIYITKDDN